MTPIPTYLLAKFATYPKPPKPRPLKPKPKRQRMLASWAAEALVHWPKGHDITADALAERTGRPLIRCILELTRAATEGRTRRTNMGGGRATTIWERTNAMPSRPVHRAAYSIAAMFPGNRFTAREIGLPNATRARAFRVAREMGLIKPVGVEEPKRATYRKV